MKKLKFTLIEFLVTLAICLILFGQLATALMKAKEVSLYNSFKKITSESVEIVAPLVSNTEFLVLLRGETTKNEMNLIMRKEKNIKDTTIPLLKERLAERTKNSVVLAQGDLYDQWSTFTGNPQNLTKQQFEVLKGQNLIKELEYHNWKAISGNVQGLTQEQFDALKAKDAISFPVKKAILPNQEKW